MEEELAVEEVNGGTSAEEEVLVRLAVEEAIGGTSVEDEAAALVVEEVIGGTLVEEVIGFKPVLGRTTVEKVVTVTTLMEAHLYGEPVVGLEVVGGGKELPLNHVLLLHLKEMVKTILLLYMYIVSTICC